ncbi:hypothetical protein C0991_012269 [Blastosporella zonata]|nr:hypothetical protein C0991_012269 [Blastosporella zonata]
MAAISAQSNLPHIPDDLTLPQFMLGYRHPLQPARNDIACLIDDDSGREIGHKESIRLPFGQSTSLAELSGMYIALLRQTLYHHLRSSSCSNPQSNAVELTRQLKMAKATFIITHSSNIVTTLAAARLAGLPSDRVVLIDRARPSPSEPRIPNLPDLIQEGIKRTLDFKERILESGEGRRKVALLSWSSGTTGKPKVNVSATPS